MSIEVRSITKTSLRRDADQIAEHHAKTVVQRHGNAQAIDFAELHRRADEVAIVENIVMRQGGALGLTGRPRRELDIDGIIELQHRADGLEPRELGRTGVAEQGVEIQHSIRPFFAQPDHQRKRRKRGRRQLARLAVRELRRELLQHFQVVAGFEARRKDQRPALHLVQAYCSSLPR